MLALKKIDSQFKGDGVIWFILGVLSLCSVLAVHSSSSMMGFERQGGNTEFYLYKHGFFLLVGMAMTYFCYRVPYRKYSKAAPVLLLGSLILLLITLIWGPEVNNAQRWLTVPIIGMTFQTSDFAKIALIIYLARTITSKQDTIQNFWSGFSLLGPIAAVCLFIAPEDLSTAVLIFIVSLLMLFIGRVSWKLIGALVLVMLVLFSGLIVYGTFAPDNVRLATWISRIHEFFSSPDGGYQILQAKIAIADGGITGLGPGHSMQKNYLPAPYSDFIFAIICEEYGLIGAGTIIGLYLWFFYRCVGIVTRSPKTFGAMLVLGLGLLIVFQAFANMAVSVHLVPVTGLTLPMLSMGGTSILSTCIAVGIILSVSKYIDKAAK